MNVASGTAWRNQRLLFPLSVTAWTTYLPSGEIAAKLVPESVSRVISMRSKGAAGGGMNR